MGRRGYPAEFRRKVPDLVEAGRGVADVVHDLDISTETVYAWRRQDHIDRRLASTEKTEPTAARKRIAESEAELAVHRRASEPLGQVVPQKTVRGDRGDGHRRPPGPGHRPGAGRIRVRVLRLAWPRPLDPARAAHRHHPPIHATKGGVYGVRWVHAEPTLGRGLRVWHGAVAMLMPRAGLKGVTGRPKWRRARPDLVSADPVDRQFARQGLNRLSSPSSGPGPLPVGPRSPVPESNARIENDFRFQS
ncbi:transposase [Nocardiopsis sp. LOL_012]|uniref:transposase n=1 Tax=Nocardiopsis sp. LOL_012 TaxID=3345409 RepID=UPI003A87097C